MKLNKPYTNRQYAALAAYGNANNQHIADRGEYLETVDNPQPTVEEKQTAMRAVRNQYLNDTDKFMLADFPIADAELENYKAYRQYLRDYTQTDEDWYLNNPLTFEEWKTEAEVITTIDNKNNEIGEENIADEISEAVDDNTGEELPVEPENKAQSDNEEEEL